MLEIKVRTSIFTMYMIITVSILTVSYYVTQANSITIMLVGMLIIKLLLEVIKKIDDLSLIEDKILTIMLVVVTIYLLTVGKQDIILISILYTVALYFLILIKRAQVYIVNNVVEIKVHLIPARITTTRKTFRAETIKEYFKLNKIEYYE